MSRSVQNSQPLGARDSEKTKKARTPVLPLLSTVPNNSARSWFHFGEAFPGLLVSCISHPCPRDYLFRTVTCPACFRTLRSASLQKRSPTNGRRKILHGHTQVVIPLPKYLSRGPQSWVAQGPIQDGTAGAAVKPKPACLQPNPRVRHPPAPLSPLRLYQEGRENCPFTRSSGMWRV